MCGRYTLISNQEKIRERFEIENEFEYEQPKYNIAPTENVLAVIRNGSKNHAGYLKWGLIPSWSNDKKSRFNMINARSETAHQLPSFKKLMSRKRCLIVADSLYACKKERENKRPERFQTVGEDLYALADLCYTWRNGEEIVHSCTILTKESDEFMQQSRPRMPIILTKKDENTWISQSFNNEFEAQEFIRNIDNHNLSSYTVSNHVNYVRNKDINCIEAIEK